MNHKFLTSTLFVLFSISLTSAQVGINTDHPTKTLDINGELRIRTIPNNSSPLNLLATDANGNITKTSAKRGKCTASTVHNGTLNLSSNYADDDFDCLYVVRGDGSGNSYIHLPQRPQDYTNNSSKAFSFKVYIKASYYTIYSNSNGGYIMNRPCGTGGGTCRYNTYYVSGSNVTSITSSLNISNSYNYLYRTLHFTWFDNKWHIDVD